MERQAKGDPLDLKRGTCRLLTRRGCATTDPETSVLDCNYHAFELVGNVLEQVPVRNALLEVEIVSLTFPKRPIERKYVPYHLCRRLSQNTHVLLEHSAFHLPSVFTMMREEVIRFTVRFLIAGKEHLAYTDVRVRNWPGLARPDPIPSLQERRWMTAGSSVGLAVHDDFGQLWYIADIDYLRTGRLRLASLGGEEEDKDKNAEWQTDKIVIGWQLPNSLQIATETLSTQPELVKDEELDRFICSMK